MRNTTLLVAYLWLCCTTKAYSEQVRSSSVMCSIDTSTSMRGEPFHQAIVALSLFIVGLPDECLAGVVRFSSSAEVIQAPVAMGSGREKLLERVRSLEANGGTDLYSGIELAAKELANTAAHDKWLVVLSDGQQTPSETRQKELVALAQRASIRVFAVALGPEADKTLLQNIAVATGGAFLCVRSPQELLPTYVGWLREIGNFKVADGTRDVEVQEGDRDFITVGAAGTDDVATSLQRDGVTVNLEVQPFSLWHEGKYGLFAAKAARPPVGRYRLKDVPPATHRVFFLKRGGIEWETEIRHGDLLSPIAVTVTATPSPPEGSISARIVVKDPETRRQIKAEDLVETADGAFASRLFLADERQIDGVYNIELQIDEQRSGWQVRQERTIRIEDRVPSITTRIVETAGVKVEHGEQRSRVTLDLSEEEDSSTFSLEVRATRSAEGGRIQVSTKTAGISVLPHDHVVRQARTELPVQIKIEDSQASEALLVIQFVPPTTGEFLLNGHAREHEIQLSFPSRHPLDLRFERADKEHFPLSCGETATITTVFVLQSEGHGASPSERLSSGYRFVGRLSKTPAEAGAPHVRLVGVNPRGELSVPVANRIEFPVEIGPTDRPGVYSAELLVRVEGKRRVTLGEKPELPVPLRLTVEPRSLQLEITGPDGKPLLKQEGTSVTTRTFASSLQSSSKAQEGVLRFALSGEGAKVSLAITVEELDAKKDPGEKVTIEPHQDETTDAKWLEVRYVVPAGIAPERQRFSIRLDAGFGTTLSPDTLHVEFVISPPRVLLTTRTPQTRVLTYTEWAALFFETTELFSEVQGVLEATLPKDTQVSLEDARLVLPDGQHVKSAPGQLLGFRLADRVHISSTGRYRWLADLKSEHPYLAVVTADGDPTPVSAPGSWPVELAVLDVERPPVWPLAICGLAILALLGVAAHALRPIRATLVIARSDETTSVVLKGRRPSFVLGEERLEIALRKGRPALRRPLSQSETIVRIERENDDSSLVESDGSWSQLNHQDVIVAGDEQATFLSAAYARNEKPAASQDVTTDENLEPTEHKGSGS